MQAADILSLIRIYLASPNANRWTNAYLLTLANTAMYDIALEVDFPEAAYTILPVAGQREYQLVEQIKILRVYMLVPNVAQQILPGSDIFTLEGDILQTYDQSSSTIVGGNVSTPQWLSQQKQAYPNTTSPIDGQVPTSLPYQDVSLGNQRPIFYTRGGFIGIVPAPAVSGTIQNGPYIVVDHIPKPPDLGQLSDAAIYPKFFIEAIAWRVVMMAREADNRDPSSAEARYREKVYQIREWRNNLRATQPKRMTPITRRGSTNNWQVN